MGFFYSSSRKRAARPKTGVASGRQREHLKNTGCVSCPLNVARLAHGKMEPTGAKKPIIYVLGESPSESDDEQGRQFTGGAGTLLRKTLSRAYSAARRPLDVDDVLDVVRFNNTVRCCPPGNRNPTDTEVSCCSGYIEDDISRTRPEVVIGVGYGPLRWFVGSSGSGINGWRGRFVPVRIKEHVCWYYSILSPANVLRSGESMEHMFRLDLENLFRRLPNLPPPAVVDKEEAESDLDLVTTLPEIRRTLEVQSKAKVVAFDLETAADPMHKSMPQAVFRPHAPNAEILTCGISSKYGNVALGVDHPEVPLTSKERGQVKQLLRKFFSSARRTCVAHNLAFDLSWLLFHLGEGVLGGRWGDTMGAGYVLDERKGMLSLDVLCLVHFGFNLKSISNIDTSKLRDEKLDKVLKYNALDAKYTYKLYLALRRMLKEEGQLAVYKHIVEAVITEVCMSDEGVPVSLRTLKRFDGRLSSQISALEDEIDAAIKMMRRGASLNTQSPGDIAKFFEKDIRRLGLLEPDEKLSARKDVLEGLVGKVPLARRIMDVRELQKLHSTYVRDMPKLVFPDGRLHPNYKVLHTSTGRLSCEDPNMQNFPKRRNKYIRNQVCAGKGMVLLSADYGAIEARVIAMASQDDNFCHALWNDLDVHMHWAERIMDEYPKTYDWVVREFRVSDPDDEKLVMKTLRTEVKNRWVFPQFYGSSLYNCAKSLHIPDRVAELLGEEFWHDYAGVKDWQKGVRKFYERHGYVETLTGRRRHGPIINGQIINTPIQGTASDIVVDASNRVRREGYVPIMNIHDDLTFEIEEEHLEQDAVAIAEIMCTPPFNFVCVPILVEMETGKKWGDMNEYREFDSKKDFSQTA